MKVRQSNIVEGNESISPSNSSPSQGVDGFEVHKVGSELDGRKTHVNIDNSGHVPKQVHQFYFVKLWPTDPDSMAQIKQEGSAIEKMTQDICQINDKIRVKMLERYSADSTVGTLYFWQMDGRRMVAVKGEIRNDLHMALHELCFMNNAPERISNKTRLDNHNLNSVMQHGSKNLAEEKKILRDIKTQQQRDFASFQSLEVIKKNIRGSYYKNHCQKLLREIEEFQTQRERISGNNDSAKGKILNLVSLKKAVKDQIKIFCDESFEKGRKGIACGNKIRRAEKNLEAKNKELNSLRALMAEKQQRRDEAYDSIFELKELYDEEITHYNKYRSLMNKVHQLAKEKDIATLDELSHSEVGKFITEWYSNKVF